MKKEVKKLLLRFKELSGAESVPNQAKRKFDCFPLASKSQTIPLRPLPGLSAIIPVYNHRAFLRAAVQSVLKNSYQNTEVIIVNDGSTDGVEEITKELKKEFPTQVKVFEQANRGIGAALNLGIQAAKGELLSWQSADNLVKNNGYTKLVDFMAINPHVEIAYGNISLIDNEGKSLVTDSYRPQDQLPGGSAKLQLPCQGNTLSSFPDNFLGSMFLFRRETVLASSGYQSGLLGAEDYALALELARYGEVAHIDSEEVLGEYRLHHNTLTASLSAEKLVSLNYKLIQKEEDFNKEIEVSFPANSEVDIFNIDGVESEVEDSTSGPLSDHFLSKPGYKVITGKRFENTELSPSLHVLPELKLPDYLLRARDSNFRALNPTPTKPALLIWPCSIDELDEVKALAANYQRYAFSLLVTDPGQVEELSSSEHLRVLDVSSEYKKGLEQFNKALLYILSSLSGTISIGQPAPRAEFLCQAALSALAGLNMGIQNSNNELESQVLLRAPHIYSFNGQASFQDLIRASDAWLSYLRSDRARTFLASHLPVKSNFSSEQIAKRA